MKKRYLIPLVPLALLALLAPHGGPRDASLEVQQLAPPRRAGDRLTVLSLNLAHGRADGVHQILTSRAQHERNLDAVAALIRREAPDVVALQEADGPSWWSGGMDQVMVVARGGGLAQAARGVHMRGLYLSYGTALASAVPLRDAASHRFAATPPTPYKGFVVATVELDGIEIDVVSLHLDFLSEEQRSGQLQRIEQILRERGRPVVLAGDFNMEWDAAPLQRLVRELRLSAWRPEAPLVTFPPLGSRIDHVLVSPELRVLELRVLPDVVSDHRAVRAVVEVAPG